MNLHLIVFSTLFFTVFNQFFSSSSEDVRSLLEFKKGFRLDPDGRVTNTWIPTESGDCPKTWHGVLCSDGVDNGDGSGSGFVTAIVLDGLGLTGDLKFSTLTGLKMLKNLSLSGNSFTGRLVPAIGTITSLQHLDLSGNRFYGPIPDRIMELWGLSYLNFSSNNFTGVFPSGRIENLQQLRVLDLSFNGLWGDIGVLFSGLRNVEHLDVSSNEFHGGLNLGVENVSSLANTVRHLNLSYNRLNGEFFADDSMRLFRNLEVLDVSQNQLTGSLPVFDALPSLRVLWTGSNLFDGSLPEGLFMSEMRLEDLDFGGNGFSGPIPNINSTTLKVLNLSSNSLSGPLPSNIGNCLRVDFSKNKIDGDITALQSWGDTVEVIDLSSNALSGNFPNETSLESLTSIKIRNNSLAGVLPLELGNFPRLSTIDLSINKLTGPILSIFFTSLTNLNLSGNQFTGMIPIQSAHSTESIGLPSYLHMESLDLSNNILNGSLPPAIGIMKSLKLLNIGKNNLSGEIPNELVTLGGLEYLDLSNNNLKGKIPDGFPPSLKVFNVSYNNLSGVVPKNLRTFPNTSFHPGNALLIFPDDTHSQDNGYGVPFNGGQHHRSKSSIRVAIIVGSVGFTVMIILVLVAYYRTQMHELRRDTRFSSQTTERVAKVGRFARPNIFRFHKKDPPPTTMSFSNDHLLNSDSSSMPRQKEFVTEIPECVFPELREAGPGQDGGPPIAGRKSSPGSPLASSPHGIESSVPEQPVMLNVYSPDRLAGELFFLDSSLVFTAEELSRAPAEVLGRSSHGTLYKATLDSGHMLTVKWLRVGLVKRKKEFAKEAKRIGTIRHPNIVSLRGYYWGPREQERLILADYIHGDSLALHLYETTPRRYSALSFTHRLKIAVDVARCLHYLHHEKAMPHGNLKPTNILLAGPDFTAKLTDYGLHRLMTPVGIAEQILNLGALGYRAPELATASKPVPSFMADVYAFGVILMEMLTRRSAGDIISGHSGAVDLTDWVRLCASEGRGMDCFDRDIAGAEEASRALDELLTISLRCILPVNERPNMRTIFEDLCSVTV